MSKHLLNLIIIVNLHSELTIVKNWHPKLDKNYQVTPTRSILIFYIQWFKYLSCVTYVMDNMIPIFKFLVEGHC